MSRTYRRKNIELTMGSSWERCGRHTAGLYTTSDSKCHVRETAEYVYWTRVCWYRPMTQPERFREWYRLHGESRHANERTPGRHYRKRRCRENRRCTQRELHRFWRNPDYEPMVEAQYRSHWWDWN